MYPTFCSYRHDVEDDEALFAALEGAPGARAARPGLAMAAHDDHVEVLVAPDGRVVVMPRASIRPGLPESAALLMMDEVEEAIEEAREQTPGDALRIGRLERTLGLLERILDA